MHNNKHKADAITH